MWRRKRKAGKRNKEQEITEKGKKRRKRERKRTETNNESKNRDVSEMEHTHLECNNLTSEKWIIRNSFNLAFSGRMTISIKIFDRWTSKCAKRENEMCAKCRYILVLLVFVVLRFLSLVFDNVLRPPLKYQHRDCTWIQLYRVDAEPLR